MANLDSDRTDDSDSNSPGEDELDNLAWAVAITQAWAADLTDARQDIYTLEDGEAVKGGCGPDR